LSYRSLSWRPSRLLLLVVTVGALAIVAAVVVAKGKI